MQASLIGVSSAIRELREEAEHAAQADVGVLLAGESGVGKNFLARIVHQQSRRCRAPFVVVNCAEATEARLGEMLLEAEGGVIFLDAIGDLPLQVQARLMRFPDGGEDVRIFCSTRVPLAGAVAAGTFREDMYYRLNLMYLEIPPLRERPSDVEPLLEHFTGHHAELRGVQRPPMTGEWRAAFDAYEWPDNVRELAAAADRLVAGRHQECGKEAR